MFISKILYDKEKSAVHIEGGAGQRLAPGAVQWEQHPLLGLKAGTFSPPSLSPGAGGGLPGERGVSPGTSRPGCSAWPVGGPLQGGGRWGSTCHQTAQTGGRGLSLGVELGEVKGTSLSRSCAYMTRVWAAVWR